MAKEPALQTALHPDADDLVGWSEGQLSSGSLTQVNRKAAKLHKARGCTMARYYFRVDYNGTILSDDDGEQFSTGEEAGCHAAVVASELGRNNSKRITVFVLDEAGAVLASAPANDNSVG